MINSMARSVITAKKWYRNMLAGNPQYSDMELISTVLVGSGGAIVITFSNIPQTYKHLQLRYVGRVSNAVTARGCSYYINGYGPSKVNSSHKLEGNGSTIASSNGYNITNLYLPNVPGLSAVSNAYGAGILDLLDYTSASKNKTSRVFGGITAGTGANYINLNSGSLYETPAITSLEISTDDGAITWVAGSRFSLYGIKG